MPGRWLHRPTCFETRGTEAPAEGLLACLLPCLPLACLLACITAGLPPIQYRVPAGRGEIAYSYTTAVVLCTASAAGPLVHPPPPLLHARTPPHDHPLTPHTTHPTLPPFLSPQSLLSEAVEEFISAGTGPAEQQIRNLVACELAYINTSHPQFIGGNRAIAQVLPPTGRGRGGGGGCPPIVQGAGPCMPTCGLACRLAC